MPSDYALIHQENIREYGEGTRHLDFLQRLYADRTHFILELLQNAEDARASYVNFTLHPDRLVLEHDGRPFDDADVRGICGIDASTKPGDLTSIGRFGIGFKSVYAYTLSPEVYSGSEHFRIRHYVRPEPADQPLDLADGLTRFVFPFDRNDVPPQRAHDEISRGLNGLNPVVLLFLRHVRMLTVTGDGGIVIERVERDAASPAVELLVRQGDRVIKHQYWQVFRRDLDHIGLPRRRVEVAFKRTGPGPDAPVERISHAPLVVYFPTDKPSGLGFLLQAPLRTTPARDNIPEDDRDNVRIVSEAAQLMVDALEELRRNDQLGLDVFDVLPIRSVDFPEGSLLRPLFDVLRDAVRTRPLVPVAGPMRHAPATKLRLARGAVLRDLLTPEQLGALAGVAEPLQWQPERLTRDRNRDLWDYLRDEVDVDEVDPEWVVERLTGEFLEAAEDSWLIRFYRLLDQNPALWRKGHGRWYPSGRARLLPIIRLEDGYHVVPFGPDDRPHAYLPGPNPSSFPTVRRAIAADQDAREFLKKLGLSEPDAVVEVIENVLPRYRTTPVQIDDEQHDADLAAIDRAMRTAGKERRSELVEALRKTAFLKCRRAAGTTYSFQTPSVAYWPDPELEHYFLPSPYGYFPHERYERYRQLLSELRVSTQVRVRYRGVNAQGHVVLRSNWGDHARGLHGFDPELHIVGLDEALTHPDERRSAYVWNRLLLPYAQRLRGTVESSTQLTYSNSRRTEEQSKALQIAVAHAWLPSQHGRFVEPSNLSLDDLSDEFSPSQALADAFGMVSSAMAQVSAQLDLPVEVLHFLAQSPEAVADVKRRWLSQREEPGDGEFTDGPVLTPEEYAAALQETFDKPGSDEVSGKDLPVSSGDVHVPGIRRQRVREDISEDLANEPAPRDRFRVLGRKVWDGKNPAVRQFLLEQYNGRCQICSTTFPKRDGTPYFEVLYLVSHTAATWIDRTGNTLCLCPTCTSKFLHGQVDAKDLLEQILRWRSGVEGGSDNALRIRLCGLPVVIIYTEKHLLELQELATLAGIPSPVDLPARS